MIYRGPCGEIGIVDINEGEASTVAGHLSPFPNPNVKWVGGISLRRRSHRRHRRLPRAPGRREGLRPWRGPNRQGHRHLPQLRRRRHLCARRAAVRGHRRHVQPLHRSRRGHLHGHLGGHGRECGRRGSCHRGERPRSAPGVTHAAFDMVTCGDINGVDDGTRTDIETPAAAAIGNVELAKVNHHGSAYSSNTTWVNGLDPAAAVISVGTNSYGHPTPEAIQRWQSGGTTVYRTDTQGDVTATFDRDATTFTVNSTGGTVSYPIDETAEPPTPVPGPRPIAPACTFDGGFEDGFADVTASNAHEAAIDCIVYWQVTTGVRPGVYNPSGSVSREQMASFVGRFILKSGGTLPASPPDAFTDDEASVDEGAINKIAAVGIVTGRVDGSYALVRWSPGRRWPRSSSGRWSTASVPRSRRPRLRTTSPTMTAIPTRPASTRLPRSASPEAPVEPVTAPASPCAVTRWRRSSLGRSPRSWTGASPRSRLLRPSAASTPPSSRPTQAASRVPITHPSAPATRIARHPRPLATTPAPAAVLRSLVSRLLHPAAAPRPRLRRHLTEQLHRDRFRPARVRRKQQRGRLRGVGTSIIVRAATDVDNSEPQPDREPLLPLRSWQG